MVLKQPATVNWAFPETNIGVPCYSNICWILVSGWREVNRLTFQEEKAAPSKLTKRMFFHNLRSHYHQTAIFITSINWKILGCSREKKWYSSNCFTVSLQHTATADQRILTHNPFHEPISKLPKGKSDLWSWLWAFSISRAFSKSSPNDFPERKSTKLARSFLPSAFISFANANNIVEFFTFFETTKSAISKSVPFCFLFLLSCSLCLFSLVFNIHLFSLLFLTSLTFISVGLNTVFWFWGVNVLQIRMPITFKNLQINFVDVFIGRIRVFVLLCFVLLYFVLLYFSYFYISQTSYF